MIKTIKEDIMYANNKMKFIKAYITDKLILKKRTKENVIKDMDKMKFDKKNDTYEYLLSMHIQSVTKDKLIELNKEIEKLMKELEKYKKLKPFDFWRQDLDDFEKELVKFFKERDEMRKKRVAVKLTKYTKNLVNAKAKRVKK